MSTTSLSPRITTTWYHLTLPSGEPIPPSNQAPTGERWASIFHIARDQSGCSHIRWARQEEDKSKAWLVLQWPNSELSRNWEESEAYASFWEKLLALLESAPVVRHMDPCHSNMGRGLIACQAGGYQLWHEIATLFFPKNMEPSTIKRIESMYGFPQILPGPDGPQVVVKYLGSNWGWVKEDMVFEGEPVTAILFVFVWSSEEAERAWKANERWFKWRLEDEECPLAVDWFYQTMRDMGMLGCESSHGNFDKV